MKKIQNILMAGVSVWQSRAGRLALLVMVAMLFVLAAGAPNATIGIGK